MSHYTTVDTRLVSARFLVKALADVGYSEVEVHEQAQTLIGWVGDRRSNSAHVIVRRKHLSAASNDLGFQMGSDGRFKALISDFDRVTHDARWMAELTRRYAWHATIELLGQQGFDLAAQETDTKGKVHLTLRRSA